MRVFIVTQSEFDLDRPLEDDLDPKMWVYRTKEEALEKYIDEVKEYVGRHPEDNNYYYHQDFGTKFHYTAPCIKGFIGLKEEVIND